MIVKMRIFQEFLLDHEDFLCHLCHFIMILSNHD